MPFRDDDGKTLQRKCLPMEKFGTATGLKELDYDRIPRAAILSASFFVASLVHVPIGLSSVHLIL